MYKSDISLIIVIFVINFRQLAYLKLTQSHAKPDQVSDNKQKILTMNELTKLETKKQRDIICALTEQFHLISTDKAWSSIN